MYFKEYWIKVGDTAKRLGVVGEEHSLYNRGESELASRIIRRYSLLAFEGIGIEAQRKAPRYEKIAEILEYFSKIVPARLALGNNKTLEDYALATGTPFINLEKYEEFYPSLRIPSLKKETLKNATGTLLGFPVFFAKGIVYGLRRKNLPAIQEPEKASNLSVYERERSRTLASRLVGTLKLKETKDALAPVGMEHFIDLIDCLNMEVELIPVSQSI